MLCKNTLQANFVFTINVLGIKSVWCTITDGNDSLSNLIYYGTVYCPPTCSFDNLVSWYSPVHYTLLHSKTIINGDFNLPCVN